MTLSEDLLHHVWKFRLFPQKELKTTDGHSIDIISVGSHNKNAGPDFDHVKIKLNNTLWIGTVEIHLRSSDWEHHNHHLDQAYNNVILHVVYQHDKQIIRYDGTVVPVLVFQDLISDSTILQYQQLSGKLSWIPCQQQLKKIDQVYIQTWLSRVLFERLEEKIKNIDVLLLEYKGSWDDILYVTLAKNFGFKINSFSFEQLARSIPQQIFAKHKNNSLQLEALLFGQAGFLTEDLKDEYPRKLKKEYCFLQKKYNLTPLDKYLWKFLRLRPQNFPTLRLAQFTALITKSNHLFSNIINSRDLQEIRHLFEKLPIHPYWETHYRFDVRTTKVLCQLGEQSIINLLINTISIILFAYGKHIGDDNYIDRAIFLLEQLSPEVNQVTMGFKQIGVKVEHAYTSQALIQLKTHYCDKKKCLHCGIGTKLLNNN